MNKIIERLKEDEEFELKLLDLCDFSGSKVAYITYEGTEIKVEDLSRVVGPPVYVSNDFPEETDLLIQYRFIVEGQVMDTEPLEEWANYRNWSPGQDPWWHYNITQEIQTRAGLPTHILE